MGQTSTTEPHAYTIELLMNPGGPGERWRPVDDFDFQPNEDKSRADSERDLFIEDGYSPDHVRVVGLTVAGASPGPSSPAHMLLLAYSEWLDSEGLVKPDHEVPSDSGGSYLIDTRPHDQLVAEFLEQHKAGTR